MGLPRPWPGCPHHTGLISASCTSPPRFRHRLSSDPTSRWAPLPRRMVPVITVHRGLSPPECISLLGTPGETACPTSCLFQFRQWWMHEVGQAFSPAGPRRPAHLLICAAHFSSPSLCGTQWEHSCVPRRDSPRRPVHAHDSYTAQRSGQVSRRVATRHARVRTPRCATVATIGPSLAHAVSSSLGKSPVTSGTQRLVSTPALISDTAPIQPSP